MVAVVGRKTEWWAGPCGPGPADQALTRGPTPQALTRGPTPQVRANDAAEMREVTEVVNVAMLRKKAVGRLEDGLGHLAKRPAVQHAKVRGATHGQQHAGARRAARHEE